MKPGPKDRKVSVIITGEELTELQRLTWQMSESFGLDRRIENYAGKRPIGLRRWDLECLLVVIDLTLQDSKAYPDRTTSGYNALTQLLERIRYEYRQAFRD